WHGWGLLLGAPFGGAIALVAASFRTCRGVKTAVVNLPPRQSRQAGRLPLRLLVEMRALRDPAQLPRQPIEQAHLHHRGARPSDEVAQRVHQRLTAHAAKIAYA